MFDRGIDDTCLYTLYICTEFQYSKNILSIHIYNSGKEIISCKISHNTCTKFFSYILVSKDLLYLSK